MKVLFKKLSRCNKFQTTFFYITTFLYVIGFLFFLINILKLSGVETVIRIVLLVFFTIFFFLYLITSLVSIILKKKKTFIFLNVFAYLFITIFIISAFVVNAIISGISGLNREYITYTSDLITLKDTVLNKDSKIGMIDNEKDIEGNILAKKLINKENIKYEIVEYNDYFDMMFDLYEGNIDGLFVSNNYATSFGFVEKYENINEDVKVVYSYSEKMENQDNINTTNKKLDEPFTMLIMGVDSELDTLDANQAFNGDTLILITFNPKTLTATMLSIPRDLYVPIGCGGGGMDKINSSAAYGSSCVIKTVENLTDVKIDYYLKINFKGVVDLVNAVGGITVDVEEPDFWFDNNHKNQVCEQDSKRRKGEHLICMNPGVQKLDGEQALAYARCRHLYLLSDIDRNKHQQDIIEALAQELKKVNSLEEIKSILAAVSSNMDSNMTKDQILSFYNVCKQMLLNANTKDESLLSIKKSYIEYYNLPVWLPNYNMNTSALGYYKSSMKAIIKMMKVNLELEEAEMIKTFDIDYNEDYETQPVGKGLTDSDTIKTMPNFVGNNESYVRSWGSSNGITINVETVDSDAPIGTIVNQSVHENVLLSRVSSLTIYISNGNGGYSEAIENEE